MSDGIPSPSPEFSQQIYNVTGNNNVKIQNKNLAWNGWAEDFVSRINDSILANLENYDNRNCLKYRADAGYGDYDHKYMFKIPFKKNTQYTFVMEAYNTSSGTDNDRISLQITYTDDTYSTVVFPNSWGKVIATSTANKTIKYIQSRYHAGVRYIDLDTFMVLEGSYTAETIPDYVPHQEQNYPFSLKSKNLLGLNNGTYTNNGITAVVNNGEITITGTSTGTSVIVIDLLKSISQSIGTLTKSLNPVGNYTGVQTSLRLLDGSNAGLWSDDASNISSTISGDAYKLRIQINTGITVNCTLKPQLEEGSTATSYEQFYDIELCKIDTAQDYFYKSSGKWYKHKEIEKILFDGSENWRNEYGVNLFGLIQYFNNRPFKVGSGLCNYYKYNFVQSGIDAGTTNGEFALQHSSYDGSYNIFIKNTDFSTSANFKTWLSTHNTEVYYPLATPTNTEVTDTTLINQLEAIYKAKSYDDQTNISQTNDELPFILDIEALKNN